MKFYKMFKVAVLSVLGLSATNTLACGVPDSLTVVSQQFSVHDVGEIEDISVSSPFNSLSVKLSGGYVVQEEQEFSWQLAPLGLRNEGQSSGEGSIFFTPSARYLNASLSIPEGTFLRIQLINDNDTVLHEYSVDSEESYELESPPNNLTAGDIAELKLIIDGGEEPITLSALFFSEPQSVCSEFPKSGGGVDWILYLAVFALYFLRRGKARREIGI